MKYSDQPHDLEAEQAVLGSCFARPEAIWTAAQYLVADDFYLPKHKAIWRACLAVATHGEILDVISVRSELERTGNLGMAGGAAYLVDVETFSFLSSNVETYAKIVYGHALRRQVIKTGEELPKIAVDMSKSSDEVLTECEKAIFEIRADRQSLQAVSLKQECHDLSEEIEEAISSRALVTGIRTGYSRLDSLTNGLERGTLTLLAARPSIGKSSLAMNIARNVATNNIPVGFYSLEMSRRSLVKRLVMSEARVDEWRIRAGVVDDDEITRVHTALGFASDLPIFIDDTVVPVDTLWSRARAMRARGELGVMIVDYLQLIPPSDKRVSRVQQVGEISSGLKGIAKELDIPVLALSQLSREVEHRDNHRPVLADLRDSGSLEQDADVVLFLYREGMYKKDVDKSGTELIIAKNRNGQTGMVRMTFYENLTKFVEVPV